MIKPEVIEQIFDTARIEEVVGDFVTLKKRGVNMLGLCPFHNEKTPSFTVSPAKGIYKCFGCGKGGNPVNFIMDHEHLTYPEALKYLARRYNIEVDEEKPTEEQKEALDERESLFNLTAFAQKHFEETLHDTEEGKAIGLTYFKERGFTTETIKKFGLGYSQNSWDDFSRKALKNGYKKELLEKSSLSRIKDNQVYDNYRGRVTFPIHNLSGRILGFGARILTQDKTKPKYINTAESEIYHKGKVLYGLYFAKSAIVREDNCCLTEGYTDVISLHQAGIDNVISSSGTSLTTEQIKLIRRYTSNITLLFDGDAAGIKAAFRGIDMILEEGLNVRIVLFPEGEDPDSYARNYRPAEVKEFIQKNANDFITFKCNLLLKEAQNDPIKKAALVKEIALTISKVPEAITRSLYVQKSSSVLQIDEHLLMTEVNKQRRKAHEPARPSPEEEENYIAEHPVLQTNQNDTSISALWQEHEFIRMMLSYGYCTIQIPYLDENQKEQLYEILVCDYYIHEITSDKLSFENPHFQSIFDKFKIARTEDSQLPNEQHFFSHPDQNISSIAINMMTSPYLLSDRWEVKHKIYVKKEEDDLRKTIQDTLYSLKLRMLEKMISELQETLKQDPLPPNWEEIMKRNRSMVQIKMQLAAQMNRIVLR
jgi:DNA primase